MDVHFITKILIIFYLTCCAETFASSGPDAQQCPIWNHYNYSTGNCECSNELTGVIKCANKKYDNRTWVESCYCVTADDDMMPVVGSCLYTCYTINDYKHMLYPINASTPLQLNNETCGQFNRKGLMCGECIEGHALPAYSYSLSCVECSNYKYNWLLYIVVAYVPLTFFCLIVIIFRISATSGSMIGYVTISQMVANYSLIKAYLAININKYTIPTKLFGAFYSIWNLDLFRSLYTPFCLHPKLSALQVLSLDYLIAVYPMILVLVTYLIVNLHDHLRWPLWLIRPLHACLRPFRREWNIKSSLISAFATLLFLSYVKILSVSFNILTPGYIYDTNGSRRQPYVYYDITVPYLSKAHLPYFIMALAMSLVFNVIPLLLLCLYPCRQFQRCIHHINFCQQWLHTFMDVYQGCYRHKPCDFRFFTSIFLVLQISNAAIFSILGGQRYHPAILYMLIATVTLLSLRPFKNSWHNVINFLLLLFMTLGYLGLVLLIEADFLTSTILEDEWRYSNQIMCVVMLCIPPCYGFMLFVYRVWPTKIKKMISTRFQVHAIQMEESLPHRLQECTPLIMK